MEILPGPGWDGLASLLRRVQATVMLLGATDSGKTTLARYLLDTLLEGGTPAALVDSDIGQSGLGLPGSISMKVFQSAGDLADFRFGRMSFLGFTNPARVITLIAAGTGRMTRIALRRAGIAVVDTTGLVSGELGKALKSAEMRAIRPSHVIALQRRNELEHILSVIEGAGIIRLGVSPVARRRSPSYRRAYRRRKLRDYFASRKQSVHLLDAGEIGFLYRGRPVPAGEVGLHCGSIIGLNRHGDTVALGVVEGVEGPRFIVRSPLESLKGIDRVVYGDMTMP